MRGATAKALRRRARAATEGAPAKAYLSRQHVRTREVEQEVEHDGPVEGETKVRTRIVNGVMKFLKLEKKTLRVTSTEVRLDPASTKGYYKHLKRQFKKGRITL